MKSEEERALGRLSRRWEDNIKMDLSRSRMGAWTGLTWWRIGAVGGVL